MVIEPGNSISLVLGSGGARGLAHIGVIRWLKENDLHIHAISGCSMGALIGGVYACGKLPDFEEWVCTLSKVDIVALLDFSWQKSGLIKGDKIIAELINLVGDHRIEDLSIKFTAVAADIQGEKEIWIQKGKIFDAIRASISLPLFFTPHVMNGVALIDGGVLNPVPIAPTFGDGTDLTIAVNLGGTPEGKMPRQDTAPSKINNSLTAILHPKIQHFLKKFTPVPSQPNTNQSNARPSHTSAWGMYDIANQAFDAMQSTIARQKLAAYPPDICINIPRDACATLEFERAKEIIQLGYDSAKANIVMGTKVKASSTP
ncbi:patatin-like phospholipase family protein [Simiduia curdlanivorans]|uniref:Patatin-like phospholipase family protein n=1 Tax=Simiduia curdlanivorans TaxID=1492769 RepID=A0ABV8V5A1_9GAMM|nr:patatin-like phospholipase family protein [Simiduia curdlanivorans]MDN3640565.1 patatin-like phospholipase family protein [Simiduia curdlanivorans]